MKWPKGARTNPAAQYRLPYLSTESCRLGINTGQQVTATSRLIAKIKCAGPRIDWMMVAALNIHIITASIVETKCAAAGYTDYTTMNISTRPLSFSPAQVV